MTEVAALPFDQYQRYRLVADLIDRLRSERPSLTILDVGGRTALLRSFLPEDTVHLVDVEASEEQGLVLGDGAKLPYRDGAFDVVCAFDTLEHVPPSLRDDFVRECSRVSRGHVLLAGPYQSPEVDEAEELLNTFLKDKLDLEHRYLAEHRENGLPDRERTELLLREGGCRVTNHGHGNLDRWLVLMCMEMYMDHDPLLRPIAERFFRFYNENLYASDHAVPVYRHVVVGAKQGYELPSPAGLLAEPVAPEGALKAAGGLGLELLAFDRDRDVWRPEIQRLEGIIKSLEQDVRGHRQTLETTEADLAAHKENLSDLQATYDETVAGVEKIRADYEGELHGYKVAVGQLEKDLADQVERYDQGQRDREAERSALQAELDEVRAAYEATKEHLAQVEQTHEQAVQAFEAERATFAEEQGKRDEHIQALEAMLEENQAQASRLNDELVESQRVAGELNATLGEREQRLERARRELRDRKALLRRAFGPKRDADF